MKNLYFFTNLKWAPTFLIFLFSIQMAFGQTVVENYDDDAGYSITSKDFTNDGIRYQINGTSPSYSHATSNSTFSLSEGGSSDYAFQFDTGGEGGISSITISLSSGGNFNLNSLSFDIQADVNLTFSTSAGGAVIIPPNDGPFAVYQNYNFSSQSGFSNITSFTILGGNIVVDLDDLSYTIPSANTPPTASSFTAANGPYENLTYTFSTSMFGYSDIDGDPLSHILIESLPASGVLFLDINDNNVVNSGEEVAVNQQIGKAGLDGGRLKYIQNGSTNTSFQFEVNDGTVNSSGNYVASLNVSPVPTVTLSLTPTSKSESLLTNSLIRATLSNVYGAPVTVNLGFSGTATGSGVDYSVTGTSITINPGNTTGVINLTNVPDPFYEGNETVIIDITSVTNGVESGTQQQTFSIIDDDPAPTVSLEVVGFWNPITNEDGGQAYVRAKMSSMAGATVTVPLSFSGTATGGGTDYSVTGTTISLSPGETMDSIRVTSLSDTFEEGDETIIITMGTPTNGIKGTPDQVTLTIIDEDAEAPKDYTVEINQDPITPSNSSNVSFTFSGAEIGATYNYLFTSSTGGSSVSGSGTISSTTQTISNIDLSGMNDGTITLSVDLTDIYNNTGATVEVTASKLASDPPFMTGLPTDISVNEGIASNIDLSGTTFGDPDAAVDDILDISYLALGGTLSFSPGVGITVNQPIPGSWTTSGTISNLNAYLSDPASIKFTSNPGVIGDNAGSIGLTGSDGLVGGALGTINIDVETAISISVDDVSVAEGDAGTSNLQFTISLNAPAPAGGATIDYATSNGSAIAGSDYTDVSGTLNFAIGETSKTIDVPVSGDTEVEASEIFTLTLSNPSGTGVVLGDATGTGLIFNDEFKKATRIYWANNSSIQSAKLDGSDIQTVLTGAYIGVRIDNINQKIYFHLNGGNIFKSDLDGSNVETIVSGAGATGISLDLANNKIYWSQFNSGKIRRANLDGTNAEDIISSTNDPFGVWADNFNNKLFWASYNNSTFSSSNLDGTNKVQIISGGVSQPWGIKSDALNGKVYFTDRTRLRRADLDGSNIESLSATGNPQGIDIDPEADKVYYGGSGIRKVNLDGTSDAEIIPSASSGIVWGIALSTEDIDVSVSVDDPSVTEGNSGTTTLTFTVSLDNPAPAGGATVDYATSDGSAVAGSDFTAASGTLSFAEGETSKTIDVSIAGDEILESDETLTLMLSNPTGTNVIITDGTGMGTITNDDQAAVTIEDVVVNESEGTATISAILDHGVQGGFTVAASTADGTATTADADYSNVITSLTFAGSAGEKQTFLVQIGNDNKVEPNETLSVSMSNLSATTLPVDISDVATLTITNDDMASVTISDVSGNEDDGAITLSATLDNAVDGGFSVDVSTADGTATTADNDYTAIAGQTLNFAGMAGETQNFTVTPIGDFVTEPNETVTVSQSNLAGSSLAVDITDGATVTILNDDFPPSGYSVAWDDLLINAFEAQSTSFTVSNAPDGSTINLSISSSGDGNIATINGNVPAFSSTQLVYAVVSSLPDGILTVTISITDKWGNTGITTSDNSATLDRTAPATPSTPDLTATSDSGISNSDNLTNDRTPTIQGTADPNSKVVLFSSEWGEVEIPVDASGNWIYTYTTTFPSGPTFFRAKAVDLAGNESANSDQLQIVIDFEAPTVVVDNPTIQLDVNGSASITPSDIVFSVSDLISLPENIDLQLSKSNFSCSDVGAGSIFLNATDEAGNTSSWLSSIIVRDEIKPTIQAKSSITLNVDAFGTVDLTVGMIDEGSTDACGIQSQVLSKTQFDRTDEGSNTVKYTVTDVNGNSSEVDIEVIIVVVPKVLTVTVDPGQSKIYGDLDPVFTYQASGFEPGDNVGSIMTGALSRDPGSDVGTYAITLGTLDAGPNYSINFIPANFEITSAILNITANAGQSKVYGDSDPVYNYQYSGLKNGDTNVVITGALARSAGEDVGMYPINVGMLDAGPNYTINFTSADFEITPATLDITTDAGQSKVYGDPDPVFTFQYSGLKNGDTNVVITGALARTSGEDVGMYPINVGTMDAGPNYTINFTGADFAITPATLDIMADAGQSKVYGEADPSFTYQYSGLKNGDTNAVITGSLIRVAGEDVGMYAIQPGTIAAGPNYTINFTSADFEISPATLTVTTDAGQTKIYGNGDSVFTYQVTGYQNGDDETILTGALTRAAGEDVGTYAINQGTLSAGANYVINFTGADFTITPRTLNITANPNQAKVYGSSDPVFAYKASNFGNGDDTSILTGALSRVAGEDVGMYAITIGTLDAGSNYVINFTSADFEIAEKVLDVTADGGQSKVFGTADPTFTYQVTGFENGDDESILTGSLARASGENVGAYAINLGTLDAGSNYAINYTGASFTITKAMITGITFGDGSFVFDGTEKSLAITGTLPAGASVAYTNNGRTDVGSQEVTATITGSNYTTLELTANLTITAKEITVTADAGLSKIAGEADPELTYTVTGLADGDGMEVFAGSLSRAAGEDVGMYAITQGSLTAGDNYSITFVGADFEIIDGDTDGDGVPDLEEENDGTDPSDPTDFKDTDGDGVPDYVEEEQGTDPADPEDYKDQDGDEVPDYVEEQQGTDPNNPDDAQDTDEDGVPDYIQERSITELVAQSIQVDWNTPEASLNLPTEAMAITGLGEMVNVPVTWDLSGYDPLMSGTTAYEGMISTIPGIFNTYELSAELNIEVLAKPAPTDVTLSENQFIGIPDQYFQEIGFFTVIDATDDQHSLSLPEGMGDNELFEVIDGILFWSSQDQRAGETQFEVVLQVEDRGGNVIQKSFQITRLRTPLSDLDVVNTFTPNADGVNDTWGVPALRYYRGSRIQVFDRGGRRLFYTEDPDVQWDGTFEGKELPVDAYFWVIEVEETGEVRRGVLNLLRQ